MLYNLLQNEDRKMRVAYTCTSTSGALKLERMEF